MMIPIRIQPVFWILAGLIGWFSTLNITGTLIWMVVILISVLVHEYGHALTAVYFGQKAQIHLVAFGGVTQRRGEKLKLWKEFIIVLNGPIFGFLLFLFSVFLTYLGKGKFGHRTIYTLQVSTGINLFWTLVNLLPVHPLDGGKLMSIVLEGMFGFKGVKIAILISAVLSAFIGLFFFAYGYMLPGALFFILTFENYRSWHSLNAMTEVDQNVDLWQQLKAAEVAIQANKDDEAWGLLNDLRDKAGTGMVRVNATQMMAIILLKKRRYADAYQQIRDIGKNMTPDFLSKAQLIAYHAGDVDQALVFGKEAYQESPNHDVAVINAYCHAQKGEVRPTVGWLQTAFHEGCPDFFSLLHAKEFDSVRDDPSFKKLESLQ